MPTPMHKFLHEHHSIHVEDHCHAYLGKFNAEVPYIYTRIPGFLVY